MNRRIFACIAVSLLVASPPAAEGAYVSLFADSTRTHNASCAFEGDRAIIELYVVLYPSEEGLAGARFRVIYPDNVTPTGEIVNDAIVDVVMGDLASGVNVVLHECRHETIWCFRQFCFVETHEATRIELDAYEATKCTGDLTRERLYVFWRHYVNWEPDIGLPQRSCLPPPYVLTGTRGESWSAVKALLE